MCLTHAARWLIATIAHCGCWGNFSPEIPSWELMRQTSKKILRYVNWHYRTSPLLKNYNFQFVEGFFRRLCMALFFMYLQCQIKKPLQPWIFMFENKIFKIHLHSNFKLNILWRQNIWSFWATFSPMMAKKILGAYDQIIFLIFLASFYF